MIKILSKIFVPHSTLSICLSRIYYFISHSDNDHLLIYCTILQQSNNNAKHVNPSTGYIYKTVGLKWTYCLFPIYCGGTETIPPPPLPLPLPLLISSAHISPHCHKYSSHPPRQYTRPGFAKWIVIIDGNLYVFTYVTLCLFWESNIIDSRTERTAMDRHAVKLDDISFCQAQST